MSTESSPDQIKMTLSAFLKEYGPARFAELQQIALGSFTYRRFQGPEGLLVTNWCEQHKLLEPKRPQRNQLENRPIRGLGVRYRTPSEVKRILLSARLAEREGNPVLLEFD